MPAEHAVEDTGRVIALETAGESQRFPGAGGTPGRKSPRSPQGGQGCRQLRWNGHHPAERNGDSRPLPKPDLPGNETAVVFG